MYNILKYNDNNIYTFKKFHKSCVSRYLQYCHAELLSGNFSFGHVEFLVSVERQFFLRNKRKNLPKVQINSYIIVKVKVILKSCIYMILLGIICSIFAFITHFVFNMPVIDIFDLP